MVNELKSKKLDIAELAIKQYGSIENYVKASESNLEKYLENDEEKVDVEQSIEKTNCLTKKLTTDLTKDASSKEIQEMVKELIDLCNQGNSGLDMGQNYWTFIADNYLTNPVFTNTTDKKYGEGASEFIGRALKHYLG